jgi:hypothetical protein
MNKQNLIEQILADMTYDETIRDGIWKHKTDTYQDFFHHCHGDMLLDDHRYKMIHDLLNGISNFEDDDDQLFEIIDSCVPIYNHKLLQWISSNNNRSCYVDEALEEFCKDITFFKLLQYGYYKELEEVYNLMNDWLDENSEEE